MTRKPSPPARPPVTGKGYGRTPRLPARPQAETDPDGVAPADAAARDEPMGRPNSDRHLMETTIARLRRPGR